MSRSVNMNPTKYMIIGEIYRNFILKKKVEIITRPKGIYVPQDKKYKLKVDK